MSNAERSTGSTVSRAEHHADSSAHRVRQSRARVCAALQRNAVGRDEAMHGKQLTELVTVEYTTVPDSTEVAWIADSHTPSTE